MVGNGRSPLLVLQTLNGRACGGPLLFGRSAVSWCGRW